MKLIFGFESIIGESIGVAIDGSVTATISSIFAYGYCSFILIIAGIMAAAVSFYINIVIGIFAGFWIAILMTRFLSITFNFYYGFRRLPANVVRLAVCTAPFQIPEVIQGLLSDHPLRMNNWIILQSGKLFGTTYDKLIGTMAFLVMPTFFLPGWVYRIILKSTLWLWWILFVIGGGPNTADGIDGLRADAYRKISGKVSILLALFVLAGLLIPFVFSYETSHSQIPPALAFFLLIDWQNKSAVQILSLLTAALTIAILLWTNSLAVDRDDVPSRLAKVEANLPRLGYLVKFKTACGMASVALLMVYIALYGLDRAFHITVVSPWAIEHLQWLYGAQAQALLGG